ncbi:DHS-like NAD/FAD-binding domain-containing protein [Trametes cingulata]|nr:DHS-like NAD/FAD-binding domain-containing protein [Trametes cingulata]
MTEPINIATDPTNTNTNIDAFHAALQRSKHIIVLAGAGLSAASGIPTFRDGGGMWRSLDPASLATPQAFAENPSLVWQFYHYRRTKALEAKPNPAHEVVAKMAMPEYLKKVAPDARSFHLITQNVDRLSVDALHALLERISRERHLQDHIPDDSSTGSAPTPKPTPRPRVYKDAIYEMHGRIFDVQCTRPECGYRAEDRSHPLCPALGRAEASFRDFKDAGSANVDIPLEELPRCPQCGALARPGVVWFDEKPYHLDEINGVVYKADMCLVVGTSSQVRPASTYAHRVQRHGGKVAVFNLDPSEKDVATADFVFRGPCEEVLPRILPELA